MPERGIRLAECRMGHGSFRQRTVRALADCAHGRPPRRSRFPWRCWPSAWSLAPISGLFVLAIVIYVVMGSARGVGGVAMNTSLMEMVPKHLMGRVQNTFYFCGTFLQLVLAVCVGAVAHNVSLVAGIRDIWPACMRMCVRQLRVGR